MSMDLALMITIGEDEEVPHMMNDASIRTVHRYMVGINYGRLRQDSQQEQRRRKGLLELHHRDQQAQEDQQRSKLKRS